MNTNQCQKDWRLQAMRDWAKMAVTEIRLSRGRGSRRFKERGLLLAGRWLREAENLRDQVRK